MTYEGGKLLLGVGDKLVPGEYLVSPGKTARALLQEDGNFVVYHKQPDGSEKIIWATHTYDGNTLGKELGGFLIVQEDHNLVLYTKDGSKAAWATNTHEKGTGRATLAVGDEGILVLVDEASPPVALWNSGPSGLKALLDACKAGATYLTERGAYYAKLAQEKGTELYHQAGEKMQPYVTAAGEKLAPVTAKASEYAHAAGEKMQPYVTAAGEKLAPVTAKASELAHTAADKASEAYHKATGA